MIFYCHGNTHHLVIDALTKFGGGKGLYVLEICYHGVQKIRQCHNL